MRAILHLVSLASVLYTSGVSDRSVKSTLLVPLVIVLGLFLVSLVGRVYTFNEVLRSALPTSPTVVLKSPGVFDGSIHKYMKVI